MSLNLPGIVLHLWPQLPPATSGLIRNEVWVGTGSVRAFSSGQSRTDNSNGWDGWEGRLCLNEENESKYSSGGNKHDSRSRCIHKVICTLYTGRRRERREPATSFSSRTVGPSVDELQVQDSKERNSLFS